jgi:hypothetical protein
MKSESTRRCFDRWRLHELLSKYPGLRLNPVTDVGVKIAGPLEFEAKATGKERIVEKYEIEISVPENFPFGFPSVRETGGRIPAGFHKFRDGSLCLASPTRLHLILLRSPTLTSFVELCVIPYLYARSYFEWHGVMPFGELEHGGAGIVQDLAELFVVATTDNVVQFVHLASMRKRRANKERCPCGSERRLGRCHHGAVNALRERAGRYWFQHIYKGLTT